MGKRVIVIIQSAPYRDDNKAWDGLRFAGAALAQEMEVRVYLLGDSAELARRGQTVPEGMTSLEPLLAELIECGLNASACGKALDQCAITAEQLVDGLERSSMKRLAGWIAESDLALTF